MWNSVLYLYQSLILKTKLLLAPFTEQNVIWPDYDDYDDKGLQPVQQWHDELDIIQQMVNLEENERLKPSSQK